MQELWANNAESALASSITSTGTSITLVTGEGARFPAAVTGTSQFRAALVDGSTIVEYVTVTNRSGDVLTVTRESEDSTRFPKAARAAGVKVVDVVTAAVLNLIGVPPGGAQNQVLTKLTSADYAQVWSDPNWGGGDYFTSGEYSIGMYSSGTFTTMSLTLNRMVVRPWIVPVRRAFDRIGINVTTAATAASGGVLRLGIYADSGGKPGALIVDAGTISSETLGSREITITQTLDPGVYWLAAVAQVAVCTVTQFVATLHAPMVALGSAPPTGAAGLGGFFRSSVSGALPTPAAVTNATNACAAALRAA